VAIASVDIAAEHFPPVTLTALRLTTASVIFSGILYFLRPKYQWKLRSAGDVVIVGILNVGLPFLCLALAVKYISSSLAAVLFNVQPVFTIAMAHLLLADEKLTRAKTVGTVIAITGATILLLRGETGLVATHEQGWIGQLFIMLAGLSGACGVIFARIRLRHENTAVLAAGQVFACTLIFVTLALVAGSHVVCVAGLGGYD
jgi:drug/metabolite transporter (DMT)-like permease